MARSSYQFKKRQKELERKKKKEEKRKRKMEKNNPETGEALDPAVEGGDSLPESAPTDENEEPVDHTP